MSENPRRIAVFSDIHANYHALKAVLAEIDELSVDRFYCCGDIIGYGAFPNECVDLLREKGCPIVAGNHDHASLLKTDINYFNEAAKSAVMWTREVLTEENIEFVDSLPMIYEDGDFTFVHSSPKNPSEWNYILTMGDARINFQFFKTRFCFIGHSHQPFIIENENDKLFCPSKPDIVLSDTKRYLVNVGSVGQPRDRNPSASFVLCDLNENILEIRRVDYDLKSAQEAIIKSGLPKELAERLSLGW